MNGRIAKMTSFKRDAESMLASPSCLNQLERVFQSKFDLTVVRSRVGDTVSTGHVRIRPRQTKIRMIEKVEEFGPELHLLRFSELEVLLRDQVKVDQVRPSHTSHS